MNFSETNITARATIYRGILQKYLTLVLLLTCSFAAHGQKITSDSLYNIWRNDQADELERLNAYFVRIHRQEHILNHAMDTWRKDIDTALDLAQRLRKTEYLGALYVVAASHQYMDENNKERTCEYLVQGVDRLLKQKDDFVLMSAVPLMGGSNCPGFPREKISEILADVGSRLQEKDSILFNLASGFFSLYGLHDHSSACTHISAALNKALKEEDYDHVLAALSFPLAATCEDFTSEKVNALLYSILDKLEPDPDKVGERKTVYRRLANSYYQNNQFPEALHAARKIIEFSDETHEFDRAYAHALFLIGQIHNKIGNYKESEKYLLKELQTTKKLDDISYQGQCYIELAKLYTNRAEEAMARTYMDSAIHIMKDVEQCQSCYTLARITHAGINNLAKRHDEAIEELQEVKSELIDADMGSGFLGRYYLELGKAYYGLHQYSKAILAAGVGLNSSKSGLANRSDFYEILYLAKERTGDYKAALEYYKNYNAMQDSMAVLRNSEEVTRMELENQFAQQRLADSLVVAQENLDRELKFQSELNTQKTKRNIVIGLGGMALLLALGLYSRLRYIRKTQAILENKNRIIEAEKDKAKESEKAKQQFLANMSHEIRTPMNAIKGMTDILLRHDPQPEQLSYLNGIRESSNSLLVIINDILDISKIEAGKIDLEIIPFSLEHVINNVQTIMQLKADEKGLQLSTDIKSGSADKVIGDPTRLHQVLLNLAGNAIKFTDKGVVTIELRTTEAGDGMVNAQFCISDTGVGIGEDRLEKIFESFEQAYSDTTRKFGGTGLGLSISKKLVEIQNGKIWVESDKGKGSRFYFTVPYSLDDQQEITASQKGLIDDDVAKVLKGIRVLLVEDNNFNAIVAREELEDAIEGVKVTVAENGVIGIEKLMHGDFDIVLMDVQMPVMNGYEATAKIRASENGKAAIPIIAMTANVMKEEIDKCRKAGMNDFIGKPFNTEELLWKMYEFRKIDSISDSPDKTSE